MARVEVNKPQTIEREERGLRKKVYKVIITYRKDNMDSTKPHGVLLTALVAGHLERKGCRKGNL